MVDKETHRIVKAVMDELSKDITLPIRFVEDNLESLIKSIYPHFKYEEEETKQLFDRITRALQLLVDHQFVKLSAAEHYVAM